MRQLISGAGKAFLSRHSKKQADVESAVGTSLDMLRGFELFEVPDPSVTVFGSARSLEGDPHFDMTYRLGTALASAGYSDGYSEMNRGEPGLMESANRDAREAGGFSMGFNMTLPHEQAPFLSRRLCAIRISSCAR